MKDVLRARVYYVVQQADTRSPGAQRAAVANAILCFLTQPLAGFGFEEPVIKTSSILTSILMMTASTELTFTQLLGVGATSRVYLASGRDRRQYVVKVLKERNRENEKIAVQTFEHERTTIGQLPTTRRQVFPKVVGTVCGSRKTIVLQPVAVLSTGSLNVPVW